MKQVKCKLKSNITEDEFYQITFATHKSALSDSIKFDINSFKNTYSNGRLFSNGSLQVNLSGIKYRGCELKDVYFAYIDEDMDIWEIKEV